MTYLTNLGNPKRGCAVGYTSDTQQRRFKAALEKEQKRHNKSSVFRMRPAPGDQGWIGWSRSDHQQDVGCRGFLFGDAREATGALIFEILEASGWRGKIDVVIGGPPCQGFSAAGKQRANDPRNNMILEYLRLADEVGADTFVMENVPDLFTNAKFDDLWTEFVRRANDLGFNVVANILDACNYGVPQRRRRLFCIGTRGKAPFSFPLPTNWNFVARVGEEPIRIGGDDDCDATPSKPATKPDAQQSLFGGTHD
jgi:site-specific DNA-cytosine methylase